MRSPMTLTALALAAALAVSACDEAEESQGGSEQQATLPDSSDVQQTLQDGADKAGEAVDAASDKVEQAARTLVTELDGVAAELEKAVSEQGAKLSDEVVAKAQAGFDQVKETFAQLSTIEKAEVIAKASDGLAKAQERISAALQQLADSQPELLQKLKDAMGSLPSL